MFKLDALHRKKYFCIGSFFTVNVKKNLRSYLLNVSTVLFIKIKSKTHTYAIYARFELYLNNNDSQVF